MFKPIDRNQMRQKRHRRIRFTLKGTAERPRLNVFRSNKQIYAQLINDDLGVTLAQANSTEFKDTNGSNIAGAKAVGEAIAKRAIDAGIKNVVFDRGGYLYHGRVKALADAARAAGLEF